MKGLFAFALLALCLGLAVGHGHHQHFHDHDDDHVQKKSSSPPSREESVALLEEVHSRTHRTAGPSQALSGGATMLSIDGAFDHVAVATKIDSSVDVSCIDSIESAANYFGIELDVVQEVKKKKRDFPRSPPNANRTVRSVHIPVKSKRLIAGGILINILDGPGVGFNDATPAAPIGGNTGTTVGAQRLNAFSHAASIWSSSLESSVQLVIDASWPALSCSPTSAVLGSAGAISIVANSPSLPFQNTWYHVALANHLAGADFVAGESDLEAQFNRNLGQTGCLDGFFFYLGLDNNHGSDIDLVTVLLHEFSHGEITEKERAHQKKKKIKRMTLFKI